MEHALGLLQLAIEFEVSELSDQCAKILKGDITKDNAIQLFNQAMVFAHKDLIKSTLDFICQNWLDVMVLDSFNDLRLDGLVEILQQDDLRVQKEIDVFNAVYRWGETQLTNQELDINTENMKRVLAKPLKYIRFPLMDPKDFGKIVAPKKLLDSDDTISLLTSFWLPLDERGDVHGTFSATSRAYLVDTDVVVYRAGSLSGQVRRTANQATNSETLQFMSSKAGKITKIVLSEACFAMRGSAANNLGNNNYSGLTVNLTFVQKTKDGDNGCSTDRILATVLTLPITRSGNVVAGHYGHLTASLPEPAEFPRNEWIAIELTFNGNMCDGYNGQNYSNITPANPYTNFFVDGKDPSVKFQFRRQDGSADAVETGFIDHFMTVLQC